MDVIKVIADELLVVTKQVAAAVNLLDEGATVPFIARYRKEITGGLDDTQLRRLEERLNYLRELNARRAVILDSISEQGKLTDELEHSVNNAVTKTSLEDLYLPFKPKRRTKAQIAREAGLEPLADLVMEQRQIEPELLAEDFVNPEKGIDDVSMALEGARQIVMEGLSENAEILHELREFVWSKGFLVAVVIEGQESTGDKFKDYFAYQEKIKDIPSHRALALFRGRNENILSLKLSPGQDEEAGHQWGIQRVRQSLYIQDDQKPGNVWLAETCRLAWKIKLFIKIDVDLKVRLREQAEEEAIRVFGDNLRDLLLAAPAGPKATIGLDPGFRTGVKVAVVDATGKVLETATIYPHAPQKKWDEALIQLATMIEKYHVALASIGNGTASRETDQLVADLIKRYPSNSLTKVTVSEAGASVYSASALAANEFPGLDVSLRGAVSIARRLQDPLAELVKIEPKAIGVGQYQHDVNQVQLARNLNAIVEDCVNAIGVDVNTASVSLLKQVSGLSLAVGQNIVDYRDIHGAFTNRQQLKQVPRLGDKAFEQAAGFLRIMHSENPLDGSGVHPETYGIVEQIIEETGKPVQELIGQHAFLHTLEASNYTNEVFGLPTVQDIFKELEKPGRDPRPEFKSAKFKEGVEKISDLESGMLLEGTITNVANFGAFVDIGVHQDGLVHISHLADKFVTDPRTIVKTGDIVKVKVIEVDIARKRIALSMKSGLDERKTKTPSAKPLPNKKTTNQSNIKTQSAMANALAKALGK